MSGIARLFNQSVSVETRTGSGAYGDTFATPTTVVCSISEKTQLVRDQSAAEVASSTTLYAPLSASPDSTPTSGQFAPGSRVTVHGRVAYVISAARQDSQGPARIHHTAVYLT